MQEIITSASTPAIGGLLVLYLISVCNRVTMVRHNVEKAGRNTDVNRPTDLVLPLPRPDGYGPA
jgi:hypothetical protein